MRGLIASVIGVGLIATAACSAAPSPSPLPTGGGASSQSANRNIASDAAAPRQAAAQEASANRTSAGAPASAANSPADSPLPRLDRMVIANVTMNASVDNAVSAARDAERIASRYGGFVGNSNVRDLESGREATMTLRIPGANLNDALADLRALGRKVAEETVTTDDVTEEYTDVDSNVRNLRATEGRILGLMDKATNVNEILTLQREVTNVRGQIERLEGRHRVLENKTSYANISLRLTEPIALQPKPAWSALDTTTQAVTALSRVGQFLTTVLVWALVFSPVYGIPLAAAWWILRPRPGREAAGSA